MRRRELVPTGVTLTQALRRAFAGVLALVAGVGVAGSVGVAVATQRIEHISRVLTPAYEANADALQLMVDAETGVRGYLLTDDESFLEPYRDARAGALDALDRVSELGVDAGVDADYAGEREVARRWLEDYAARVVAGEPRSAAEGKRLFDDFRAVHQDVADALADRRTEVRSDAREYRAAVVPGLLALTVLGLTFVVLVTRSTVRTVAGPLGRVQDVLEQLRVGEHAARAPVQGPVEVRYVALAVNGLADESDRLRAEHHRLVELRARTRDAARNVRDELGLAAVLVTAARALGELLAADGVLVRHLPTGDAAPAHDVADGVWASSPDRTVGPLRRLAPEETARVRRLARLLDMVVVAEGGASVRSRLGDPLEAEERALALRLAEVVLPSARTCVLAPVTTGDTVTGLAVVAFEADRDITDDEAEALERVCGDVGRALEQSDVFERQLQLVDRLQELDRQKTVFLSNVSHELRTPLTSITGYTELLLDGDGGDIPDEAARMVEVVRRNGQRLRDLIEDLLTISRMESGVQRSGSDLVDLVEVARAALTTLEPQARAGEVVLEHELSDDVPHVRGDAGQLEHVVLNLVGNAVKFTPAGGSVCLIITPAGGDVRLVVRDTGIGIPEAEQPHLFDRFFRASNAVEGAVPGTGLGLAIARGVVESHGGTLTLRSAAGEGTEVTVVLPGDAGR